MQINESHPIIKTIINKCWGNILFDSEMQTSLISENFIKKNKSKLRDFPPYGCKYSKCNQITALIIIRTENLGFETMASISPNLIYDVIIGTDTLNANINFKD